MRHILVLFFLAIIASCAIPTSYDFSSDDLEGLECIELRDEYILYRSVNSCPLFSSMPTPKSSVWTMIKYDDAAKSFFESQNKYSYKLTAKNCELPTSINEFRLLKPGTKLLLTGAYTRNDTVRHNRLFLSGNVTIDGNNIAWLHERNMNNELSVRKRITPRFKVCVNNT